MGSILGISAYYHDSAAALLVDGRIVGAAQEERFSRRKHDAGFPSRAVEFCLDAGGIGLTELDAVVFYDKPLLKFERLLESYLAKAPRGYSSFVAAIPVWIKEKLFLKGLLRKELAAAGDCETGQVPRLLFTEHHQSHAASAFFPSPFRAAAVLCMDGVGEWATTSAWLGEGGELVPLWEIQWPHSLGLLYSAFTYYAGFRVNSGEYKLMGLAPYGEPRYADRIRDELLDLKQDGSFRLNMAYFDYVTGLRMTNERFHRLFGAPPRSPDAPIEQHHMDVARSVQVVLEDIVLRLAVALRKDTGARNLCLAGGVALNCVANGRLLRESGFDGLWIQPASGDAGGAVGGVLSAWHQYFGAPRDEVEADGMRAALLGPEFDEQQVTDVLKELGAPARPLATGELEPHVAALLADGKVVGWFQGPMEYGPRALGNRSILGDPRDPDMQTRMNLKIKYRESFRPFAPAVLRERCADYFRLEEESPYMLLVADVVSASAAEPQATVTGFERLRAVESAIPAVTHVDGSARVQTVDATDNPRFHRLLECFAEQTGVPVLINTSFNVRGEPIVCTPEDAYRCFLRTEMDYLVLGDYLLERSEQPVEAVAAARRDHFAPD